MTTPTMLHADSSTGVVQPYFSFTQRAAVAAAAMNAMNHHRAADFGEDNGFSAVCHVLQYIQADSSRW